MKPLVVYIALGLGLFTAPALLTAQDPTPPQPTAPATLPATRELIDSFSDADLARILPLLRENYLAIEKLNESELSRATVEGLLTRLAPGVKLLAVATPSEPPVSVFRSEIIDEKIGHIRLGSLNAASLTELDAALTAFTEKGVTSVILDLRATPAGSQFDTAAEICNRFCPKGKVLFSLKKPNPKDERLMTSKDEPRLKGMLVVLVDGDTSGAAEVIAAVLRDTAKAMVIGQKTKGEAAEFIEVALPSGKLLRIAVGKIQLDNGTALFPEGVKPDLVVEVPQETTDAVLKATLERGVKELVTDLERPRLNEAALVAGINPELEAYQATQMAKKGKGRPPLRDLVLQRAFDFITTLAIYKAREK